jgi:NAD(P)-dependent dehydrogenase (short-subunit alcohol dehydrogenase family)
MSWGDRVAIITGGANGIGLACALAFARKGAKVVIADVDQHNGLDAEEQIRSSGGQAKFVHCDVADRLDIHNLLAATLEEYGRVDVLVNNAGVVGAGRFLEIKEEEFDRILRINLRGAFLTAQAVAKQMVKQIKTEGRVSESGRFYSIINMSSVEAVVGSPEHVPYAVSKGALSQLTKVMSLSLAEYGIRVNAVGPGNINTEVLKKRGKQSDVRKKILSRTPLGRIGDPEEIGSIAVFLASQDASYITGQTIYADGGRLALNLTIAEDDD